MFSVVFLNITLNFNMNIYIILQNAKKQRTVYLS